MKLDIDIKLTIVGKSERDEGSIISLLGQILKEISTMSQALTDLTAKVEALETVEESAITLLTGLKAALDEAIASGDTAALQALSERLGADTERLAAAVTANTLAE